MKKRIVELLKKKKIAAGLTAVVLAVAVGGVAVVQQNQIPELPSYTDPVMETTIDEEETPLAAQPKVNTQTSNSTSTKKVKMKKSCNKNLYKNSSCYISDFQENISKFKCNCGNSDNCYKKDYRKIYEEIKSESGYNSIYYNRNDYYNSKNRYIGRYKHDCCIW